MDVFSQSFIIIIIVAVVLYIQIQKLTKNIDINILNQPEDQNLPVVTQAQKYKNFCGAIDKELREIKNIVLYDDELKDENFKDEFLENLSNISKKLTFIETMNSNKNVSKWENELFSLLNNLNSLIEENLKNGEKIADELRGRLQKEFKSQKSLMLK